MLTGADDSAGGEGRGTRDEGRGTRARGEESGVRVRGQGYDVNSSLNAEFLIADIVVTSEQALPPDP